MVPPGYRARTPLSDDDRNRLNDPDFWRRYLFADESADGFADIDSVPETRDHGPHYAAFKAAYEAAVADGADREEIEARVRAALDAVDAPRPRPDLAVEFTVGRGYALAVEATGARYSPCCLRSSSSMRTTTSTRSHR